MNRIQSGIGVSVVLAGLVAFCTAASAVPMRAVYSGKVTSSFDRSGLFGLGAGNSLDSLGYTLTFEFDPSRPGASRVTTAFSDDLSGGTGSGFANPMASATLTINGQSTVLNGGYASYAYNLGNFYSTHFAEDYENDGVMEKNFYIYGFAYDFSSALPVDLQQPFSTAPNLGGGYFRFSTYDFASNQTTVFTYGNLTAESLTVTRASSVPLPGTLALFVSGLCVLCVWSWRSRSARPAQPVV